MLRGGRLRNYIRIERNDGQPDPYGQAAENWVSVFPNALPAGVEPIRGRELQSGNARVAEVTHRIVLRYVAGILPDMRVTFKGRVFEIKSVIDRDERNRDLELMCVEVVR